MTMTVLTGSFGVRMPKSPPTRKFWMLLATFTLGLLTLVVQNGSLG